MRKPGMTKDPVVQTGDLRLTLLAKTIAKKDIGSLKVRRLIKHMQDVLAREEFGVALAAPQVGEGVQMFMVAGRVFEKPGEAEQKVSRGERRELPGGAEGELSAKRREPDRVFINPTIIRRSKKTKEMSEGCLSVRGKYGTVLRHEKVSLTALDEQGTPLSYNATGLLAHIFQHEVDHLNGILYTDKAVKIEEDEDMASARNKLKQKHGV